MEHPVLIAACLAIAAMLALCVVLMYRHRAAGPRYRRARNASYAEAAPRVGAMASNPR